MVKLYFDKIPRALIARLQLYPLCLTRHTLSLHLWCLARARICGPRAAGLHCFSHCFSVVCGSRSRIIPSTLLFDDCIVCTSLWLLSECWFYRITFNIRDSVRVSTARTDANSSAEKLTTRLRRAMVTWCGSLLADLLVNSSRRRPPSGVSELSSGNVFLSRDGQTVWYVVS